MRRGLLVGARRRKPEQVVILLYFLGEKFPMEDQAIVMVQRAAFSQEASCDCWSPPIPA